MKTTDLIEKRYPATFLLREFGIDGVARLIERGDIYFIGNSMFEVTK
jgi:hypothetical protein